MQTHKLFNVLVLGGALLVGGAYALEGEPFANPEDGLNEEVSDAKLVLCPDDKFCEVGSCGKKHVKAGFECCWGTSCDKE